MSASRERARRSGCPIAYALDLIGDRWTLLVVRDLVFGRKRHFGDFLASPEGIATNVLSSRLRQLEEEGLVLRRPDPDNARKVIYELTDKGIDLIPVLLELILFGARHDAETEAPAAFVRRVREDRAGLVAELVAALRRR